MNMIERVLASRQALDAEKARRDKIVFDGMMTRWQLYLATWDRVEKALRELVDVKVRVLVLRVGTGTGDVYEDLPLQFQTVGPPDPHNPSTTAYNQGRMRLLVCSERTRKPLGYRWEPPPPPKRRPRGWRPPEPPLGEPYVVNLLTVACAFDPGYWSHEGRYSHVLDDYCSGARVWKTDGPDTPYVQRFATETEILEFVAQAVAPRLVTEAPLPEPPNPPTRNLEV